MTRVSVGDSAGRRHSVARPPRAFPGYRALAGAFQETRKTWGELGAYQRFEQLVLLVLTSLIAVVVVVALGHLLLRIMSLLFSGVLDPADQSEFQVVFGMVMTVLITLEFNHSIVSVAERRYSIVHVSTLLLIALLAIMRQFIVLNATMVEPMTLFGLAVAVLALGVVYWLVREDARKSAESGVPT
jgi:uncharacterized membrane protein (DUF373 family)